MQRSRNLVGSLRLSTGRPSSPADVSPFGGGVILGEAVRDWQASGILSNCVGSRDRGVEVCQIDLKGKIVEAVLAVAGAELTAPLPSGRAGALEFGFLALPYPGEAPPAAVRFTVKVTRSGTTKELFAREVQTSERARSPARKFAVEVPASAGEDIALRLESVTDDGRPALTAWLSPVFLSPGRTARGVILVSLDTVRWDFVGPQVDRQSLTPNLDRLAGDGVVFESAYATAPWTIPSHASILTGVLPRRHAVLDFADKLSAEVPTVAETLRNEGFLCYACTGGGAVSHTFGFTRGFLELSEKEGREEPDSSTPVFRAAADMLARIKGSDFFLFLHTYQFHDPLNPPSKVLERVAAGERYKWSSASLADLVAGRRKYRPLPPAEVENLKLLYRAELATIDERLIGPLLSHLEREGLYDDTLLVVTSDHGDEMHEHGGWQHAHSLYDEVIHVPLIVKFPRQRFAGARVTQTVSSIDIVPTILNILNLTPPVRGEGRSLTGIVDGSEAGDRSCFMEATELAGKPIFRRRMGVVRGSFKLIISDEFQNWRDHFDFAPPATARVQLFDRSVDPHERTNCLEQHPEMAESLMNFLREYASLEAAQRTPSALDVETEHQLRALGYLR